MNLSVIHHQQETLHTFYKKCAGERSVNVPLNAKKANRGIFLVDHSDRFC